MYQCVAPCREKTNAQGLGCCWPEGERHLGSLGSEMENKASGERLAKRNEMMRESGKVCQPLKVPGCKPQKQGDLNRGLRTGKGIL